ncbi:hypothetical protein POVWA1_043190 [Plasmodium ovale wallikeri]|uniref:Secreted protein n=1 Tax=Plasmodium ovale wallikeri TaxID=864142 RepID=A0A1A8ZAM6_PLAOA|nr:hypothetical protein POVWA1_043190 [Plasmodium ovale wallikeri]
MRVAGLLFYPLWRTVVCKILSAPRVRENRGFSRGAFQRVLFNGYFSTGPSQRGLLNGDFSTGPSQRGLLNGAFSTEPLVGGIPWKAELLGTPISLASPPPVVGVCRSC